MSNSNKVFRKQTKTPKDTYTIVNMFTYEFEESFKDLCKDKVGIIRLTINLDDYTDRSR